MSLANREVYGIGPDTSTWTYTGLIPCPGIDQRNAGGSSCLANSPGISAFFSHYSSLALLMP